MKLEDKAHDLARLAHAGQTYNNQPYFDKHILGVRKLAMQMDPSPEISQVAYLHDIVEDTPVTLALLEDFGFGPDVVRAVDVLTHEPGTTYDQYIEWIVGEDDEQGASDLVRVVKWADLTFNWVHAVQDPNRQGQAARYKAALRRLLEVM